MKENGGDMWSNSMVHRGEKRRGDRKRKHRTIAEKMREEME